MNAKLADRAAILEAMKAGGYYDCIMDAGPELDRLKAYLRLFGPEHAPTQADPLQYPDYPLFPGLRNRAFRPAADLPGPGLLEENFRMIRDEWEQLAESEYLRYTPSSMHSLWQVHLLYYMGVNQQPLHNRFPRTHALLRQLPGVCLDYPWGDALVSVHASDSHLSAHCSVDNLRVRCHLALQVPPGCNIRVGTETRSWEEGKALVFEDSFEHEVWNRGQTRRAILIVDFWHPDLSACEIEALTA
ncbi:MAG: aspartyl/asparaginyl beta-hydroxylase domain-containing protein, partial [Burkholderiales bacterium]